MKRRQTWVETIARYEVETTGGPYVGGLFWHVYDTHNPGDFAVVQGHSRNRVTMFVRTLAVFAGLWWKDNRNA
jgi:hypothetical protein